MDLTRRYNRFVAQFQLDELPDQVTYLDLRPKDPRNKRDIPFLFLDLFIEERNWKIKTLILSQNRLTLPLFGVQISSLTVLNLSETDLTDVPDLPEMPHLEDLDLSINSLSVVPDFPCFPVLKTLNLASNRLARIPNFSCLSTLERLFLSDNLLSDVPDLHDLTRLRVLHLQKNLLSEVPLSFPPRLESLILYQNRMAEVPEKYKEIVLFGYQEPVGYRERLRHLVPY